MFHDVPSTFGLFVVRCAGGIHETAPVCVRCGRCGRSARVREPEPTRFLSVVSGYVCVCAPPVDHPGFPVHHGRHRGHDLELRGRQLRPPAVLLVQRPVQLGWVAWVVLPVCVGVWLPRVRVPCRPPPTARLACTRPRAVSDQQAPGSYVSRSQAAFSFMLFSILLSTVYVPVAFIAASSKWSRPTLGTATMIMSIVNGAECAPPRGRVRQGAPPSPWLHALCVGVPPLVSVCVCAPVYLPLCFHDVLCAPAAFLLWLVCLIGSGSIYGGGNGLRYTYTAAILSLGSVFIFGYAREAACERLIT